MSLKTIGMEERESPRASKQGVEMILLTDEEFKGAVRGVWDKHDDLSDSEFWSGLYTAIAREQLKKTLKGVGKESKRMDGTIYLVPDYVEYRKALKEVGLK